MKVVQASNYDDENFKEVLFSDSFLSVEIAMEKCQELNRELDCNSSIGIKLLMMDMC